MVLWETPVTFPFVDPLQNRSQYNSDVTTAPKVVSVFEQFDRNTQKFQRMKDITNHLRVGSSPKWILQRICPVLVPAQAEQVLQVSRLNSLLCCTLHPSSLNVEDFITANLKLIRDVGGLNTVQRSVKNDVQDTHIKGSYPEMRVF